MKSTEQLQFARILANTLAIIEASKKDQFLKNVARTIVAIPNVKLRQKLLEAIYDAVNESEGIIKAEVTTATEINAKDKKELRARLTEKYQAVDVDLRERLDPEIIGGMRVRVGDEVYDDTIRKSLKVLAQQLHA